MWAMIEISGMGIGVSGGCRGSQRRWGGNLGCVYVMFGCCGMSAVLIVLNVGKMCCHCWCSVGIVVVW